MSHDLVTGHGGTASHSVVVVYGVDINVSEAVVSDRNPDIVFPKFLRDAGEGIERLLYRSRGLTLDG
jgi:hypothetical protein